MVVMMRKTRIWPLVRAILTITMALGLSVSATRGALAAEVIFKSIAPNGDVSYAWRPEAGAAKVEQIDVTALTPEQRRAIKRFKQEEFKAGQTANADATMLESKSTRADIGITQAQGALEKAEQTLQAGRTPLPGERKQNVDGYSRLTQVYFDRLKKLEQQVAHARQLLDKAYGAREALD
jgi:hypothetical protein